MGPTWCSRGGDRAGRAAHVMIALEQGAGMSSLPRVTSETHFKREVLATSTPLPGWGEVQGVWITPGAFTASGRTARSDRARAIVWRDRKEQVRSKR